MIPTGASSIARSVDALDFLQLLGHRRQRPDAEADEDDDW